MDHCRAEPVAGRTLVVCGYRHGQQACGTEDLEQVGDDFLGIRGDELDLLIGILADEEAPNRPRPDTLWRGSPCLPGPGKATPAAGGSSRSSKDQGSLRCWADRRRTRSNPSSPRASTSMARLRRSSSSSADATSARWSGSSSRRTRWQQPPRPDDADNPVTVVFSAACPVSVWAAFEERFALRIYEGSAAVDGGGGGYTITNLGQSPIGSIGIPASKAAPQRCASAAGLPGSGL